MVRISASRAADGGSIPSRPINESNLARFITCSVASTGKKIAHNLKVVFSTHRISLSKRACISVFLRPSSITAKIKTTFYLL